MKTILKIAVATVVSFLCGCIVTAWAARELYCWMEAKEVYVQPCAEVTTNIRIIQELNNQRVPEAIELLESKVDSGLIMLSAYSGEGGENTRKMVEDTLQTARAYRQENPREPTVPAVDAAVEKALKE